MGKGNNLTKLVIWLELFIFVVTIESGPMKIVYNYRPYER